LPYKALSQAFELSSKSDFAPFLETYNKAPF
jgi:hypothetical protein